jgi:hypothetical protein
MRFAGRVGAMMVLGVVLGGPALADPVFDVGGTFTAFGTNAPTSFSQTVTLASGTVAIDGGQLNLTTQILAGPASVPNSEWVVFGFATASGGPIAPNVNAAWELGGTGVPLVTASTIPEYFLSFTENGTNLNPTSGLSGFPPLGTDPITGSGTVFLAMPGPSSQTSFPFFASLSSFSQLNSTGIPASSVTDFEEGILVQPLSPVPAPLIGHGLPALLAVGGVLFGAELLGRSKRRRSLETAIPHAAA